LVDIHAKYILFHAKSGRSTLPQYSYTLFHIFKPLNISQQEPDCNTIIINNYLIGDIGAI